MGPGKSPFLTSLNIVDLESEVSVHTSVICKTLIAGEMDMSDIWNTSIRNVVACRVYSFRFLCRHVRKLGYAKDMST